MTSVKRSNLSLFERHVQAPLLVEFFPQSTQRPPEIRDFFLSITNVHLKGEQIKIKSFAVYTDQVKSIKMSSATEVKHNTTLLQSLSQFFFLMQYYGMHLSIYFSFRSIARQFWNNSELGDALNVYILTY